MQHATCNTVPTCNIRQPRPHSRACTFGLSSRECAFMLNHVARFLLRGCTSGLHEARVASCILSVARLQRAEMLRITTCCEPTGNFIAVLHDGQMRTSSSCRTADHAEPRSRIPLSVFGFSGHSAALQGTLRRLGRLRAAVESICALHDASRAARCMLHLVLRVACCPQRP